MTHTDKAFKDGHLKLTGEGKTERIIYVAVGHSERWSDPEEKVRAEYYAELIYVKGYEPQRIGVEVVVPDRTPNDSADLVVFHDDARKKPYAVIECKKDGITDAEFRQAVDQAFGNGHAHKFRASYVGVVAGKTRAFFDCSDKFGVLEREENMVSDLPPRYGKPEEFKFYKDCEPKPDIQPVSREDLIKAIRKCHQTLWGGGKLSPPAAFGELCKLIFVKISDEQTPRKDCEPYQFQIKTNETPQRLGARIRALYAAQQVKDPEIFTETIKIDDATIRNCVLHLESINLSATDLDTKGVAFEQFMDGFFKGDFGQYFTPREIIRFAVEMLDPQHDDYTLDPACGSGGFLLYALDHVRHEAAKFYPKPKDELRRYRHWHDFAQHRLFGIEINDEIARVAKMNMIIHDDGHTNVIGWDALESFGNITARHPGFMADRFDLVLTNPPFGAMIKQTEKPYLAEFELSRAMGKAATGTEPDDDDRTDSDIRAGKRAVKQRTSVKTEILFCERVWQFLKPGTGRAAVILPDGILTNSSLQGVRDWILERFQVLAVVSLPQFAFAHFGAGVKSSVVFLRKRAAKEKPSDEEAIFMAAPERIGYDATGRKTDNELPTVAAQYRLFQKDPKPFFV